MAPEKCPRLSRCPAGSERPRVSWSLLLFVIMLALVIGGFYLYVRRKDRIQRDRAKQASRFEQTNMLKTVMTKLSRMYDASYHGKSFALIKPVVRICFSAVGFRLKGRSGKVLLSDVHGEYQPGQLHAIMGPSGCGAFPI